MLTNVRFRLQYPGLGVESGDLYGKVVAASEGDEAVHRIRLTSVDATDQKIIEDVLADASPVGLATSCRQDSDATGPSFMSRPGQAPRTSPAPRPTPKRAAIRGSRR